MKSFTLQPVQEDVRRQIQATNEILEAIGELNSVAEGLETDKKANLNVVIEKLAKVTDRLLDNAGATSKFIREASV